MSRRHTHTNGPSAAPQKVAGLNVLALPFDTLRSWHATGVQAGFIRRSMLEARDFELALVAAERLLLGPLARRV